MAHSGFAMSEYETLFKKDLEKTYDMHSAPRTTQEKEEDEKMLHTFINDNYNEISYLPAIMYNLNQLTWRRVDLDFNSNVSKHLLC